MLDINFEREPFNTTPPLSPDTKEVIKGAYNIAELLGSPEISSPHLLYGLVTGADRCMVIARAQFGFNPYRMRSILTQYRLIIARNKPDSEVAEILQKAAGLSKYDRRDEVYTPALFVSVIRSRGMVDIVLTEMGYEWSEKDGRWRRSRPDRPLMRF